MNNVCNMMYECTETNKITETPMGCPDNKGRCKIRNQHWGCVCNDNEDETCHGENIQCNRISPHNDITVSIFP